MWPRSPRKSAVVATERARGVEVAVAVERPILRLGQQILDLAQRIRREVGQRVPGDLLHRTALVGETHIAVATQTRAGGNGLADDDVLLQAGQVIGLALDGGVGEHLGGLLERRGGQPRIPLPATLVMPSSSGWPTRRLLALGDQLVGHLLELEAVHLTARQEAESAGIKHGHLAQHLARDDLDVLVVDIHRLGTYTS